MTLRRLEATERTAEQRVSASPLHTPRPTAPGRQEPAAVEYRCQHIISGGGFAPSWGAWEGGEGGRLRCVLFQCGAWRGVGVLRACRRKVACPLCSVRCMLCDDKYALTCMAVAYPAAQWSVRLSSAAVLTTGERCVAEDRREIAGAAAVALSDLRATSCILSRLVASLRFLAKLAAARGSMLRVLRGTGAAVVLRR